MRRDDLPFVVKVCGITNEDDARAAIEAGANALGFNFYVKSPRCVTPERAQAIIDATPGKYLRVGVFVNATDNELAAVAVRVELDVFQLHGERSEMPSASELRVWRSVAGGLEIPAPDTRVEAYLLDSVTPEYGGSGKTFTWSEAEGFPYRAIVAGGLDGGNVAEAIATLHPWGVDACSRLELAPGLKDLDRVRAFVHAATAASANWIGQKETLI